MGSGTGAEQQHPSQLQQQPGQRGQRRQVDKRQGQQRNQADQQVQPPDQGGAGEDGGGTEGAESLVSGGDRVARGPVGNGFKPRVEGPKAQRSLFRTAEPNSVTLPATFELSQEKHQQPRPIHLSQVEQDLVDAYHRPPPVEGVQGGHSTTVRVSPGTILQCRQASWRDTRALGSTSHSRVRLN